ncbi:MAG: 23S rRNA (uracil(1939)-C(5))-methyltransferase RlmD [Muribaculaceae bacterium]|nr:23S rRNA (uracil(1939)-C(5))-methyltransferase RlmD [Muribaculaceae bacterium]
MARKKKPLPLLENVRIESFAAEGKTVTRVFLKPTDETPIVLFVPFAVPGDLADVQVTRKKHSYAEGKIVRLIEASPLRVEPRCTHFGVCGGCKWQDMAYKAQTKAKQQQVEDALRRIGKVEIPPLMPIVGADNCWEYRNKMEYTFSNKKWRTWEELSSGDEFADSSDALGFHIGGSFDKVLQIDRCWLQADIGNRIRNFIYDYARSKQLAFYDIRNNVGLLRNLMIRNTSTGEVMLIVVFGEDSPEIPLLLEAVGKEFPEITSLGYIINLKLNDSIADQEVIIVRDNDYITEEMEGLRFRINPKSFYQTNSAQAYRLYSVAREFAGLDKPLPAELKPVVYDLYTGAGTIANFVARNARKVVGVEYVEEAIVDARLNSALNGIDNTVFYAGDMKDVLTPDFIAANGLPDIMIIDPPRAGMHPDVVNVILEAAPKVLVYVSCNPATQARDLQLLSPKYRVTAVRPVDMFPHTQHVENVVRLELI